ncbi:MAG: HNH endonuclease [Sinobacteraceae bacterium]|nr:HNH endonuclease [Nevskiaceae bacterium]
MAARFWWVNHPSFPVFDGEPSSLWFAQRRVQNKTRAESERNVQRLLPGDLLCVAHADALCAAGVVLKVAQQEHRLTAAGSSAPTQGQTEQGFAVPVRLVAFSGALRLTEHAARLIAVMPRRNAPLRAGGSLNRDAWLTLMPAPLVATIRELLRGELEQIVSIATAMLGSRLGDDAAEAMLQQRSDLDAALRLELLNARFGQGLFRANVEQVQQGCRITGLLDRRHVRAVHIKPWARSSDAERLDGHNGVLLSPHLAQLFERGYLSFSDAGALLLSRELNPAVLRSWSIDADACCGTFAPEQHRYLEFHRREVFARHGGGRRVASLDDSIATDVVLSVDRRDSRRAHHYDYQTSDPQPVASAGEKAPRSSGR